jgi:hypothetical protein
MVSRIVKWCRWFSFEFAAVFQNAIVPCIPDMVVLLRYQASDVQQRAVSALGKFARHGEQDSKW